jgi:PKD domain
MDRNNYMRYIVLLLLLFLNAPLSYSQWVNLNTGINDNLTGVVFLAQNGLASGANGLYYTTNGGVGAGSWTRFEITANASDATIYENTVFTHCYSNPFNTNNSGFAYACGKDEITNKAIIIKIALPSLAYEIKYIGVANSKLNKIEYSNTLSKYVAVGDNGLLLSFTDTTLTTINTGLTDDLLSISASSSTLLMGSNQKVFRTSLGATTITAVTVVPTTNSANIDVALAGNSSFTYALGDNAFSHTDLSSLTNFTTRYNQNYFGSLNANGMILNSSNFYIGTNQGIYRCSYATSNFQNVSVEWQTSSLNHHIKDFWKQQGTTDFYAFGNNGVILKTNGNGGATKPYVRINSNGGCFPEAILLDAITGSGTSYNWYSNGNLIQTGTNSFTYNFPSPGQYTISLTVQNNAGEQSTDTKVIHAVQYPQIDKTLFSVSKK